MRQALLRWLSRCWLLGPDRLDIHIELRPYRMVASLYALAGNGKREIVRFRVDGGASRSSMSLAEAQRLGIRASGPSVTLSRQTASGRDRVTAIRGSIRLWLSLEQWAVPFDIPINFIQGQHPDVPPLLGLEGVTSQLWIDYRGRPHHGFPDGRCSLRDDRPASERYPP